MNLHRMGWLAVAATLLMAAHAPANAACDLVELAIDGVVVDEDDAPVANASVEARWEERVNGTMSNRRDADALGRFTARVAFDTYSGRTFGGSDKCEAKLDAVTLVFGKPGFRATEMRIDVAKIDGPVRAVLKRGR